MSDVMSAEQFESRLAHADERVARADQWAQAKFQRFPRVSVITLTIGASVLVDFSVSLTWNRQVPSGEVGQRLLFEETDGG